MLVELVVQILVLPLVLSCIFSALALRFASCQNVLPTILLLVWLISYCWILNWPNFPPRLVQDWFGLAILFFIPTAYLKDKSNIYSFTVFVVFSLVMVKPVFSFEPELSDFLTLVFLWVVVWYFLFRRGRYLDNSRQSPFLVSGICVLLGLVILLGGSSLIGFLCLSLAAAHGAMFLIALRSAQTFNLSAYILLIFLFLTLGLFYVDLEPWIVLAFSAALMISSIAKLSWYRVVFIFLLLCPAIVYEITQSQGAYRY